MKWRKVPPSLIEAFTAALPRDPRVEPRQMFGCPCAFTGGNMFAGLHQESLLVRLPEDERARLLALDGAAIFEPMPGRPMREYCVVPVDVIEDADELRRWVARAFAYAASLPSKAAKKETPATAKKRPATAKRTPATKGTGPKKS